MMFSGVMSGKTGRAHCGLPCGVLRYMCAWMAVILPTSPVCRKLTASVTWPEEQPWWPICTVRWPAR